MLGETITITYNAVAKVLAKVNQDNFGAVYRLDDTSSADKNIYELSVKHTIPQRGKPGESHLVRLDVLAHDALGVYVGTTSAWVVIKSNDAVQNKVIAERTNLALAGLAATAATMSKVIGRES